MEAKLISYNMLIIPERVFSALVAQLHGFWAVLLEYMWETNIMIVNLEKVDVVLGTCWSSCAYGAGQLLGLW